MTMDRPADATPTHRPDGTLITETGGGIIRERSVTRPSLPDSPPCTPPETDYNRLPCGCPIDSGCSGWHGGA